MVNMSQTTTNSDELMPGACHVDKTPGFNPELDVIIDLMPAVVSIGTSNDEEEVELPCDPSENACIDVDDNRNDLECRDDDYCTITSESIPAEEASKGDCRENEIRSAHERLENGQNVKDIASRVKFGTHMVRDSVITNEHPMGTEEPQGTRIKACYNPDNSVNKNVVFSSDEYCSSSPRHATNYTSDIASVQERPVKSILKIPGDSSAELPRHSRHINKLLKAKAKLAARSRQKRAVTFSSITLRTYDIILGDHPNCKFGAPISIGWDYHECNVLPVDIYEKCRGERKKMKKLYLNSGRRRKLLERAGFSIEEISDAINDVQIVQLYRKESAEDVDDTPPFLKQTANLFQLQHNMKTKGWKKKTTTSWSKILKVLPSGKRRSNF